MYDKNFSLINIYKPFFSICKKTLKYTYNIIFNVFKNLNSSHIDKEMTCRCLDQRTYFFKYILLI